MKKIVITGGSGFVGKLASEHFESNGYHVTIVSRSRPAFGGQYTWMEWDGKTKGIWAKSIDGSDVVLNLSGKSVNCRYTEANKALLFSSRLDSTRVVGEAIQECQNPPELWMNASSATIHSNFERPVGEHGPQAEGFSPDLVRAWENELFEAKTPNTRRVALRMGLILDSTGSTMTVFRRLAQFGLAGKMGSGEQHIAWLHKTDLLNMLDFIIAHSELEGPVNAVAPNPAQNKAFMRELRAALGIKIGLPATDWMIRLGAAIIGTSPELVLWNRNVVPTKLCNSDFRFRYPTIDVALRNLLSGSAVQVPKHSKKAHHQLAGGCTSNE